MTAPKLLRSLGRSLRSLRSPRAARVSLAGLLVMATGCSGSPTAVDPQGSWGGEGVLLDVEHDGAALEFDCARGTVDVPFVVGADETFDLTGTFTPGQGGPDREGFEPMPEPATYRGRIDGDVMVLRGVFGAMDTEIGPYELRKGQPAVLRRCL